MNSLHLLWIIPLALSAGAIVGFFTALLLAMAAACDEDEEKSIPDF